MRTNVSAQDGNSFRKVERAKLNWSTFNMSHSFKASLEFGQITPVFLEETLPQDKWEIRSEIMFRMLPLLWPVYHRLEYSLHFFYVPNRILWRGPRGWEDFISRKDLSGWAYTTIDGSVWQSIQNIHTTLYEYYGIPTPDPVLFASPGTLQVNVLPFAGYWKIYDEYYLDDVNQQRRFVEVVEGDNPEYSFSGANFLNLTAIANFRKDYFTAGKGTPSLGEDVLIPMVNSEGTLKGPYQFLREADDVSILGVVGMADGHTYGGRGVRTGVADFTPTGGTPAYLDIQSTAATIRELRGNMALQSFLERLNRSSQRYRDFIQGFFGNDPQAGVVDDPIFLGGYSAPINITEVMQTATTIVDGQGNNPIEGFTPTGEYVGQATAMGSSDTIRYNCGEHGFIHGLLHVKARSDYYQGLHRMWTRNLALDYAFPDFQGIGDQAVLTKELWLDWEAGGTNNTDFCYVPRFQEYRTASGKNRIAGEFRNKYKNYHYGRNFATAPVFDNDFFYSTDGVDYNGSFTTYEAGDQPIYVMIWHNVIVKRVLSQFGEPTLQTVSMGG